MQSVWAAKIFGDPEDPRRRLQDLFGGDVPESGQPPLPALDWARAQLAGADASEMSDVVGVTQRLRRAEPRLTLKAATFLATHAAS